MTPQRFAATIYRVGPNYCVDVPLAASRALAAGKTFRVAGELFGRAFVTTLVPRGGGAHRLFLNGDVRAAAGVSLGDHVEVEIAPAPPEPEPALPPDLRAALAAVDGGLAAWDALPPAARRGMPVWVAAAKSPETRAKRIARVVDNVRERLA